MDSYITSDKKQSIITTTWEYLLKTGLSNASIGDLCREAKLAQSSLYYWFENKDDIWISAGKYGISKVVSALLDFTLKHTDDIRKYFDMGDLGGLIAPRTLILVSGEKDVIFPIDSAKKCFEITESLYKNTGGICRHITGPDGHRFYYELAWDVYDEIQSEIKQKSDAEV